MDNTLSSHDFELWKTLLWCALLRGELLWTSMGTVAMMGIAPVRDAVALMCAWLSLTSFTKGGFLATETVLRTWVKLGIRLGISMQFLLSTYTRVYSRSRSLTEGHIWLPVFMQGLPDKGWRSGCGSVSWATTKDAAYLKTEIWHLMRKTDKLLRWYSLWITCYYQRHVIDMWCSWTFHP